ncbi:unnamed protein product [Parascedosporium putredinis]|uniref:Uncharacterized protein n=1 Tax=Parascedosporium putredinis TaxID=1442378 RepID=A0A9P1H8A9_9PEZI|nr:unnamed protein product [Parascedosporium putredinis]CAI7999292.1 unnamed protein product [Parascedosporium putredinis]
MNPRPVVCHGTETQPARNLAEADRQPRTPPGLGIISRFYKADVHPPVPLFALPPTPDEFSTWRPTSSVYSHNPLVTSDFANLATYGYYGAGGEGISPPSSPEMAAVQQGRDVSPIDEFPDKSGFDQRPSRQPSTSQSKSNIPMMRRQRRQTQEAAAATLRESKSRDRLRDRPAPTGLSSDAVAAYPSPGKGEGAGQSATGRQVFKMANGREMKWDAMTGEPTLGPKGYSAQVKPAEYAQEFGAGGHGAGASGASAAAAPASNPAASALSRLRTAGPSVAVAPERVHTLSPEPEEPPLVQRSTTPSAQPSATARPPRAASLAQRPQWKGGSGRVTLVDPVHDTPQEPPVHIPRKSSKRTANLSRGARGGPGGPRAPNLICPKSQRKRKRRVEQQTTSGPPQPPPLDSLVSVLAVRSPPPVNYSNVSTNRHNVRDVGPYRIAQAIYGRGPTADANATAGLFLAIVEFAPGRKDNLVITMNQPYMSGARGGSSPIGKPMGPRDAVPSYLRSNTWGDSSSSVFSADARPGSVASTSKALPPAPPEINPANDRVGYLNARLQSLANRRLNINKSIKKMTEMMPTDNLMASDAVLRKREAEKVKIESLKVELSEVQREEYELGLKLHRAYKRQDRDAEYEPTTLWVRRVTGA